METVAMGKVVVSAKIENLYDLRRLADGLITEAQVHRVEAPDARVDTGATILALPKRLIDQLALRLIETKQAKTPTGLASFRIYESVRLTVQGRDCDIRVSEVADTCPVLIGFLPLEMLDFVVDPRGERLIGNPDHGGENMIDML